MSLRSDTLKNFCTDIKDICVNELNAPDPGIIAPVNLDEVLRSIPIGGGSSGVRNYFPEMTLINGYSSSTPFLPPNNILGNNIDRKSIPSYIEIEAGTYIFIMKDFIDITSNLGYRFFISLQNAATGANIYNKSIAGTAVNYYIFTVTETTKIYLHLYISTTSSTAIIPWTLSLNTKDLGFRIFNILEI